MRGQLSVFGVPEHSHGVRAEMRARRSVRLYRYRCVVDVLAASALAIDLGLATDHAMTLDLKMLIESKKNCRCQHR